MNGNSHSVDCGLEFVSVEFVTEWIALSIVHIYILRCGFNYWFARSYLCTTSNLPCGQIFKAFWTNWTVYFVGVFLGLDKQIPGMSVTLYIQSMVFYSRESSNYSKQFDEYKVNQLKYVASVNVNTQLTSRERCASENIGIVYDVYDWHVYHVCSNMSQYINHIAQRTWHLVHNYIQQAQFVC